jgi:RHS repeat-associated protein
VLTFALGLSIVLPSLPQPVAASGNSHLVVSGSITSISVNPNLTLTLNVDKSSAIPGDRLTYSGKVTHIGSTACVVGSFSAQNTGSVTSTLAHFFEEIDYWDPNQLRWVPLAGVAYTQTAFVPVVTPQISTGITLTVTSVPAGGVTYPPSGNPMVGTTIAAGAKATWNGSACITLTAAQLNALFNSPKVREVKHFEDTPGDPAGEEWTCTPESFNPLRSGLLNARNVVVTITPPTGPPVQITSSTVPAFSSLAPGASADYSTVYVVPVVAAKGSSESDIAYVGRLRAVEGSVLQAKATVSATGPTGPVSATAPPVATTEHLPILSIAKSGPTTIAAGVTETNPLSLNNSGGAIASGLVVTDSVPSGTAGTVTGVPATLAPAATASASAAYPVPSGQPAGNLTDTASVTWKDANANNYGPVSSSFTTTVSNNLAGASLKLSPATAGPNVVGTSQPFTAVLLDRNSVAISNQAITLSITGANPATLSGTTDVNGSVSFSYSGASNGTDQVQASAVSGSLTLPSNTVSVSWITPIVPASTSVVSAKFFYINCLCFNATPNMTPVFTQQFPTINFNPPTGSVPRMPASIGTDTRPMMSVATDTVGNFTGATVVQGTDANGVLHQAGFGDMSDFQGVFTGSITVGKAGQLTYSFFSDDGFVFGMSGGDTRVGGALANPPPSGLTAFTGYPVMGAFNGQSGPQRRDVIVNFPAPGTYPYEMDYFECCGDGIAFTVGIAGITAMPPTGNLALSPSTLNAKAVGQPVTLNVSAMDASGVAMANLEITLTVTGANARQLRATADSTGFATFTYQGVNAGTDQLQASAQVSGLPEISNVVTQTWNAAPPAPTITAPSPLDGSIVTTPVNISATFAPPAGQTIVSWSVTYQAIDPGAVVPMASGTGTPPATLAIFDPTLLPNDAYAIAITATASGGGVQTITTTVIVLGYLKPGRFITTYQDLNVPAYGFQMQVRRTYDSFDKNQGDFGVGWRVSLNNFRVSTNRTLGAGGWTQYNTQCGLGLCLTAFRSTAPHFVTIVYPDQHTEVFDFSAKGGTNIFVSGQPTYTPRPNTGTTSTLAGVGDGTLGYTTDGNLYLGNAIYDPQQYRLTTLDGTVLILDRTKGLVSMTDRNGNWIQVSSAGITARQGQGITYTRDASGRITKITDPLARALNYAYSTAGDLATFTDANGNQTTFTYDTNHNLLKAFGPAAQPLQTQQYDSAGRMVAITDANGNTAQISNNVAGRQQTVIDPTGLLTTVYTFDDLGDVLRQDQVFDGKTLTTTATYDVAGRPLSRTDPLGHKWAATYDGNGNLLSVNDPLNHAVGVTYDAFGAPLTFTDPAGNVSKYAYDSAGNLVIFTNALGQVDRYSYNSGVLSSHTDGLGRTWSYNFDGAGNMNAFVDSLHHGWGWSYDGLGHMTFASDAAGNGTSYSYDAAGNFVSTKDPLGRITTFTYNALNEMVSCTDALGKTTTYTYDGNRALASATDPLGNVTRYTYDAAGRQVSITDPAGGATSYAYDGSGRLASQKDPIGRVTSYAYDNAGRLITKTLPNAGTFTYAYDDAGHQTAVTDPLGHATSSSYDADGRLVSTSDALGKATTFVLDALGRQVKVVDPLNQTTQHAYDAAGELVSDTDALGKVTTYGYDGSGSRSSVTDALGHTTTYQYDQGNRLNMVVDPLRRFVVYTNDALGRVYLTRLNSAITTSTAYDELGRVVATNDGLHTTSYTFDAAGRRASMTDPRGNTTNYGYDAAGRQTSITDPLGGKVTFAYDLAGQKTSVVNPRGDTMAFTYDSLGNVLTQTDPAGKVTTYAYDLAGRLASKTDPRGIVVSNTYDAADRLTGQTFPGGTTSFVYDAVGRRTSMIDPTGSTGFSYDANSRLAGVAAPQGTVSYAYDAVGNRTLMSILLRGSVTYAYDAANQLTTLTDWAGKSFGFSYSPDGLPASIARPGGVNTTYGYDGADSLTSVHHDGPAGSLARFDYTLDANGNRTSVTSAAGTESYTLDALNRLTGVTYPNADTAAYTYDAAGNRLTSKLNGTTTNYTYDAAGRLTAAGGNALTYDAASNVMASGTSTFGWDWAGRLASANVNGTTSNYTYDADSTRVAAVTGAATTNYIWDRATALPLLVDDGTQGYVQTDQGLVEQLGASASYPLSDALGSVRSLASPTASVLGTANYDAFGSARAQTGQASIFGYTGQQTDSTGLSYFRARYYNPALGRFLSSDSVQPNAPGTQGYNLFSYVANNSTTATDPTGNNEYLSLALNTLRTAAITAGERTLLFYLRYRINILLLALAVDAGLYGAVVAHAIEDTISRPRVDPQPTPDPTPSPFPPVLPRPSPSPKVLFHYTSAGGFASIMASQYIRPSIQQSPDDKTAAYGSGQYFTDLPPSVASTRTKYEMSYALYSIPYQSPKVMYVVAVDVTNIAISRKASIFTSSSAPKYSPTYGVFLHSSMEDLSVAGRIVVSQSGPVAYVER